MNLNLSIKNSLLKLDCFIHLVIGRLSESAENQSTFLKFNFSESALYIAIMAICFSSL